MIVAPDQSRQSSLGDRLMQRLNRMARKSFRATPRWMNVEQLEDRRLLTITVNSLIDELDGSIVDGDISLRDALAAAPTGETIDFAVSGTILLDGALGELTIDRDLTIDGPSSDELTINAQGSSYVIVLDGSAVVDISGLSLTNASNRGVLVTAEATGMITESSILNNGGGLYNLGTLFVTRCTITGNSSASRGGGIYNREAPYIYGNRPATLVVNESTISGNTADAGGGIHVGPYAYSQVTVLNSTISGNSATFSGGGVDVLGSSLRISNSTISGNTAGFYGGGISNHAASTQIEYSTITHNAAGSASGGAGVYSAQTFGSQIEVRSSLIAGNADGQDLDGPTEHFVTHNYNLVGGGSSTAAFSASSDQVILGADPQLGPLTYNGGLTQTHAVQVGSPALDAGRGSGGNAPDRDQRGAPFSRWHGARIDIGAYEAQPFRCDFNEDGVCDVSDLDALVAALATGINDATYDLTGDGLVDLADRDQWLVDAGALNLPSGNAYRLGDANLDGAVDGIDFVAWNDHKFSATGKWSEGDWNADGLTNGADFVFWNDHKFTSSDEASRSVFAEPLSTTALTVRRIESIFAKRDDIWDGDDAEEFIDMNLV